MSSSVIAVNALTKRYAARTGTMSALEDISFSVDEGEFVAVVGPSGCGKSTLLKILAGILPSTAGEARLRGTAIAGPRKDIGVVFQAPVLFPWRSVLDNVLLPIDVQRLGLCRRLKRVQLRGGARRPHARRTPCALSVRPRAPQSFLAK